jgi:hypothetical protein
MKLVNICNNNGWCLYTVYGSPWPVVFTGHWLITPSNAVDTSASRSLPYSLVIVSQLMAAAPCIDFLSKSGLQWQVLTVKVKVTSRLTVSQSICLGVGHPFGAHDQILLFPFFCRKIALLFILGCPLWQENGSVICSALCQWSELRRTHNHYCLIWDYWIPFLLPLTTRRDYGEIILTRLHTGKCWLKTACLLIRSHFGPHRKHCLQQFLYCCMRNCAVITWWLLTVA